MDTITGIKPSGAANPHSYLQQPRYLYAVSGRSKPDNKKEIKHIFFKCHFI